MISVWTMVSGRNVKSLKEKRRFALSGRLRTNPNNTANSNPRDNLNLKDQKLVRAGNAIYVKNLVVLVGSFPITKELCGPQKHYWENY